MYPLKAQQLNQFYQLETFGKWFAFAMKSWEHWLSLKLVQLGAATQHWHLINSSAKKTRFYRRLPLSQQFWFPFFCYIMKCYNSQPKHFHHAMLQKLRHFLCSSFKSNSGTKNQQRFSNDMKKFKTINDSTRCIKLFPQHDFRFNISVNVTLA